MVCETANYKYIEKRRKNIKEREEALAKWYEEKRKRKESLKEMKRRASLASTATVKSTSRRESTVSSSDVGLEDSRRASEASTLPPKSPSMASVGVGNFDSDTQHTMGLVMGHDSLIYGCRNRGAQIVRYTADGERETLLQGEMSPLKNRRASGFCSVRTWTVRGMYIAVGMVRAPM